MSRIAPAGVSSVQPRITSELSYDGKARSSEERGRTRWADVSRSASEIPSIRQLQSRFQPGDGAKAVSGNRATAAAAAATSAVHAESRLAEQQSSRKRMSPEEDAMNMEDPEKYFESTNHTQRFQQTRALFAKMEEQTRLDQEQRRRQSSIYRSKSPTRFPGSSRSSLAISPATVSTSTAAETKLTQQQRSSSTASTDPDHRYPAAKFSRYTLYPFSSVVAEAAISTSLNFALSEKFL